MAMTIDSEWQTFLRTMETANSMDFPTGATTESNKIYDSDGDGENDDNDGSDDDGGNDNSDDSSDECGTRSRKRARPGENDLTKPPVAKYNRNPCEDLYISTQTKIFFLNQSVIDVDKIFWNLNVIPYTSPSYGVIKKQMRVVFKNKEEFQVYQDRLQTIPYYTEKIMKQIDNPNARKIKFKDVRKITIGVSKKDIMNCHGKNKNAFINCFAVILRVQHEEIFHEIHVKVFNTGRMAIPGIVNENLLESTKSLLLSILQPNFDTPIKLISEEESPEVFRLVKGKKNKETNKKEKSHFEKVKAKSNVLINSNFNCGYYIQQEKLRALLRDKYKLNPTYDPSMYPGVKCKFYYNNELPEDPSVQLGHLAEKDADVTMTELDELTLEKYTKISFMIFRTGNCLIVGNCTKKILSFVYEYVKNILTSEYETIKANQDIPVSKIKKHKPRKKLVQFSTSYYHNLLNIEKSI